ncbi:hypothetical protein F5Y16DRAFT_383471 [Xylariaceae sp. FL0255]|nr:hypothetical protein F5Y16DRAFT_383471 [Xylariaceae sp. FL0255]
MSLRIPFHNRDDDATISRTTSHRSQLDSSSTPAASRPSSPLPQHRNVAIPDPIALAYLEEDKSVIIVERKAELRGYELYLVEQWACSRELPTSVIVTYTGDERHTVIVGVLSVPADDKVWSPRLRIYFKTIQQYHARPKYTDFGELMVTNLSSFPSALTVIAVPGGNIKEQRKTFTVNEDLKRLGCSGRSGMTLSEPAAAAKAKFHQLYKTDDKISTEDAVIELVKLCQVALHLFGSLGKVYIDGLLCDVTETAIGNWWTEFGAEYFNMEPTDGILGPTTVTALLGLLMGARNRLSYLNHSLPKDVFDMDATERGISSFQKYNKLERSRRLDRQTMHRLHMATAKAAAGKEWGVQKAVKSTVTEIGGKRGEMVLGMVGGRDKGGIGDIETTDLDRFISLVSGERSKWLWHGKPRRAPTFEHDRTGPEMISFGKDDPRSLSALLEGEGDVRWREESPTVYSAPAPGSSTSVVEPPGDRDALRRGAFKNVARSGFGKIKDAVTSGSGFRGHSSKPSRDDSSESNATSLQPSVLSSTALISSPTQLSDLTQSSRAFTWKNKPEEYLNAINNETERLAAIERMSPSRNKDASPRTKGYDKQRVPQPLEAHDELAPADLSAAASDVGESATGLEAEGSVRDSRVPDASPMHLRRRHSIYGSQPPGRLELNEARWPRRLSFSTAEDAVLTWEEISDLAALDDVEASTIQGDPTRVLELAQLVYGSVSGVEDKLEPWVKKNVRSLDALSQEYSRQMDELQLLYQESSTLYERTRHGSQGVVVDHREHLTEAVNRLEGEAAKIEYEIAALQSRVEDVEDATSQFEMQVEEMEARADELKAQLEKESWLHWAVRTITGIGTGPNITKPKTPVAATKAQDT